MYYKKYVSIHSEDRNILKFPNSSEFEIELPEDILNVAALRLVNWTFPANYNTFSFLNDNVGMTFLINNPYNPNINGVSNILYQKIFECLFLSQTENFIFRISDGFYNPQQMVTELTNKFNNSITNKLTQYFTAKSTDPALTPSTTPALETVALAEGVDTHVPPAIGETVTVPPTQTDEGAVTIGLA
jgi:hypothetical protein